MSKYLKLFETTSQYNEYINGSDVILPNVSVAEDAPTTVHFSPLVAAPIATPTNIIIYEASAELAETTSLKENGLHTNAFSGTGGQLTITSHTFESGVGTIEFDGDVTSIGDYAFYGCTGLTSIEIPNSVTSIGSAAFYYCSGLTSITIPDGVTSIGGQAFGGCTSLANVTISDSVTNIGYGAFITCTSLTNVIIPDSVTSIGDYAFADCSGLTNIICNATKAPAIQSNTFKNVKIGGTLTVPTGSAGYDVWMGAGDYYLGKYNWTKTEQ